jgi:hypothetical protein
MSSDPDHDQYSLGLIEHIFSLDLKDFPLSLQIGVCNMARRMSPYAGFLE